MFGSSCRAARTSWSTRVGEAKRLVLDNNAAAATAMMNVRMVEVFTLAHGAGMGGSS
jgi:hypothetical protein